MSKIRNFLFAVNEEQDKRVVEQVLDSFDEEVVPKYDLFRKGWLSYSFHLSVKVRSGIDTIKYHT